MLIYGMSVDAMRGAVLHTTVDGVNLPILHANDSSDATERVDLNPNFKCNDGIVVYCERLLRVIESPSVIDFILLGFLNIID